MQNPAWLWLVLKCWTQWSRGTYLCRCPQLRVMLSWMYRWHKNTCTSSQAKFSLCAWCAYFYTGTPILIVNISEISLFALGAYSHSGMPIKMGPCRYAFWDAYFHFTLVQYTHHQLVVCLIIVLQKLGVLNLCLHVARCKHPISPLDTDPLCPSSTEPQPFSHSSL